MIKKPATLYFLLLLIFLVAFPASKTFAQIETIERLKIDVLKSNQDTNRVRLLNLLSFTLRLSNIDSAEKYRKEALKLSYKINYPKGIAWGFYLEGVIFTYQNKLMKSINSLTIALDLAGKAKDYELIARIYNGIGVNNLRLEDDYNAMHAFESALVAIRKVKDQNFESALLHNIGSLYVKNKRFNEAIKILGQSIRQNLKKNNKTGLAINYKELGLAFLGIGNYQEALINGNKALTLSRETDFTLNEINSLTLLGAANLKLNEPSAAKKFFDLAYQKAGRTNIQREKLLIYQGYTDYYQLSGNYKQAYFFQDQYTALYDSLYNVGRSKIILEYQEKFQAQQKETENSLLRNLKISTENQVKQKNQILLFIFAILIGFIFFSGLIIWGNKRIKAANRLLTVRKNQIQIQKDNMDQLNSIKDKLFSVIAHDLRSPFASLKSMMDMYEEGMISKEDVDYFFREIRKDIGSNSLLLDNLLIWAKSQLDGFKVLPLVFSMETMVNEITLYYSKQLDQKHIKLINRLDKLCIVSADYEMVKTIVRNLAGNAIKFTPDGGSIIVSYQMKEDEIHISIMDSGIGISGEAKEKLFQDTFFTTQGLNKERGTGLGLQICKEFVEKNNGRIWVESEPGQGSAFTFSLPGSDQQTEDMVSRSNQEADEKVSLKELINIARLQKKHDRFELLLKASNDTIWDWDFSTNQVTWSDALASNFGYSIMKTTSEWWEDRVHPDNLPIVRQSVNSAIKKQEMIWEMEYRFLCADNTYKYVLDRCLIVYDNNKAIRILGIMQNIDQKKNAIREIQRLSLVATNVNNLVVITDADGLIVWVNKAFESLTGYVLQEVLNKDLKNVLSGQNTDSEVWGLIERNLALKVGFIMEVINYTKAAEPYWVQINCTPYDDPISNQIGYIFIHTIITEQKINAPLMQRKNEALREIARISSHEVRSPLASILGLVKLIQNNSNLVERQECIKLLDESAGQLEILIRRINDHISEIENQEA